ncbi:MAG: DUF4294 domain-containing protein [Bacteroidales bacterium]|nr:DUF4294 domain-containing protein [Bacteroidales bacterium]
MRYIFAAISIFLNVSLSAQTPQSEITTTRILKVIDGDTMTHNSLPMLFVSPNHKHNKKAEIDYNRLMRDVKKMYPYAQLAKATLIDIRNATETMPSGSARDAYVKQQEKDLLKSYGAELKKCTVRQGRILLKLVDREVNQTSYEIIKDLRGSFSAMMWQGVARLFGETLKTEYDAKGEDAYIEYIVCMIELGMM